MSFTIVEEAPARLNRSELAVPGSSTKFLQKAAESASDVIFLDLEDAVAPDDKPQARKNIVEALNDLDWSGKTVSVRINGLDTHYCYKDVIEVVEGAGDKLDLAQFRGVLEAKFGCAGLPDDLLFRDDTTLLALAKVVEAGGDPDKLEDELGDLLFTCVNLARKLGADPETALRRTISKFERRFRAVEDMAAHDGKTMKDYDIDGLEAMWVKAKATD